MILCDKNAFVLAMDLKAGVGVVSVYLFVFVVTSAVTLSTAVKISYAIGQVTGTGYNWIKIQVYR